MKTGKYHNLQKIVVGWVRILRYMQNQVHSLFISIMQGIIFQSECWERLRKSWRAALKVNDYR